MQATLRSIRPREILDARVHPTVGVDVQFAGGSRPGVAGAVRVEPNPIGTPAPAHAALRRVCDAGRPVFVR
jgi:hypothetical protein